MNFVLKYIPYFKLLELAQIFQSQKGYRLQDSEGHIYHTVSKIPSGQGYYWRCQMARQYHKCKSKIQTSGNWIIKRTGFHNHN